MAQVFLGAAATASNPLHGFPISPRGLVADLLSQAARERAERARRELSWRRPLAAIGHVAAIVRTWG